MRVLLVGSPPARARLAARLGALAAQGAQGAQGTTSIDIVGEFPSFEAARASGLSVDALVVSPDAPGDVAYSEPLTPREIEVVQLLAQGLPNKAVAARLGISDQTVKFHLSSIYGKLGAANRTDAVRRAVRRGLVTL